MNTAQQVSTWLANILEEHKDLDFVSDGTDGGFDFEFKDGSKVNVRVI